MAKMLFPILLAACVSSVAAESVPGTWLLVVNASVIHSMDAAVPQPEAFCVDLSSGRVAATGSRELAQSACNGAKVLDVRGAVILPGLIDSHAHPVYEGRRLSVADITAASDEEAAAEVVRAFAAQHPPSAHPQGFVQGFGWDQTLWLGGALPTKASLDAVLPSLPVYVDRIDGHTAWVNSMALQLAGINSSTPDPEGGQIVRDEQGEPTGVLVDNARIFVHDIIPPPTVAERRLWLQRCFAECAALGLTGLQDMGQDGEIIDLYQQMADEDKLTLRINAMRIGRSEPEMGKEGRPTDPKLFEYKGLLSVKGVKFFLDGALGSWGAAMLQNYSDRPDQCGALRMTAEEFKAAVRPWVLAGWQVATHAIGDKANRVTLDVYEATLRELNLTGTDHRFRIEHAQILALEDIPRFSQLGVLPSMQPIHAMYDLPWARERVGDERLAGAYAWQKMLASGVKALPFGSDFPTSGVVNPWLGIYAAVARQDIHGQPPGGWLPEERVSPKQALRGYTLDAAFAAGLEASLGSISAGKFADFVVVDRDILSVEPPEIKSTQVLGTYLGGKLVGGGSDSVRAAAALRPTGEDWQTLYV